MNYVSLHAFSKENGLNKSTVHRRCVKLGLDTAKGLNPENVKLLRREFDLEDATVIQGEVVDTGTDIVLSRNTGVPAIPSFGDGHYNDVRDISRVRMSQGRSNLETYVRHVTGAYIGFKMEQHLAGVDAAFANVGQEMSTQADQSITTSPDVQPETSAQVGFTIDDFPKA